MTLKHLILAMNTAVLIWAITLGFTIWAGWLDWRTRKIPNWLTIPGIVVGVGVHFIIWGWHGALVSLEGAGLALLILLPFVLLRTLGAGDWKLMGAVGSMLGPAALLAFLYISALVAGVMALATVIWARRTIATFKNIAVMIHGFFVFGLRGNPQATLDNPDLLKIPFGVAAAITAMVCFVISRYAR